MNHHEDRKWPFTKNKKEKGLICESYQEGGFQILLRMELVKEGRILKWKKAVKCEL